MRTKKVIAVTILSSTMVVGTSCLPDEVMRWEPLVREHFPPEEVYNAMAIMACESMGDPRAHNKKDPSGGSVGLFQINGVHGLSFEDRADPETNIAWAAWHHGRVGRWGTSWGWYNCARKLGIR